MFSRMLYTNNLANLSQLASTCLQYIQFKNLPPRPHPSQHQANHSQVSSLPTHTQSHIKGSRIPHPKTHTLARDMQPKSQANKQCVYHMRVHVI